MARKRLPAHQLDQIAERIPFLGSDVQSVMRDEHGQPVYDDGFDLHAFLNDIGDNAIARGMAEGMDNTQSVLNDEGQDADKLLKLLPSESTMVLKLEGRIVITRERLADAVRILKPGGKLIVKGGAR